MKQVIFALGAFIAIASGHPAYGQDPAISTDRGTSHKTVASLRRAYEEGRDRELIVQADTVLVENSGVEIPMGEVHFWRGASLNRLKRHDEALIALGAAHRQGFQGPELHLERALALSALGRDQEAEQELGQARRLLQEDGEKLDLLDGRWRSRRKEDRKFQAYARPFMGYDSNIVAVSDDTALVDDVDRESFYYGLSLSARYLPFHDQGRLLAIDFVSESRAYSSESDLSYTDNTLSFTGRVPLRDAVDAVFRVSLSEAFLAEDGHFRTLRSMGPSFLIRPGSRWEVRLWADWSDADYYTGVPAELDRDGQSQQVGASIMIPLEDGWAVKPYVTFSDHDTEGSDYERQEWQVAVWVQIPEIAGVQPQVTLGYIRSEFDNPNSLTGFTDEREDRRMFLAVTVTLRALEGTLGFAPSATIRFEDWGSNVDAYEFTRWRPQIDFSVLAFSF